MAEQGYVRLLDRKPTVTYFMVVVMVPEAVAESTKRAEVI